MEPGVDVRVGEVVVGGGCGEKRLNENWFAESAKYWSRS